MVDALDFIHKDLYFEAYNLAIELTKEVAYYCSKNEKEVKCFDIERYVTEVEDVDFLDYSFDKHLNTKMLGSISKTCGEILITTNKNLHLERKNFTKMHEIIHYYIDIPYISDTYSLSDMVLEKGYLPEDIPKEYRANVGASILLANDCALLFAIHKFNSFNEVAGYFFMSKSALHNRIKEYLVFMCNCTPYYAYKVVYKYRMGNKIDLLNILKIYRYAD